MSEPLNYSSYLRLDDLLRQQVPRSLGSHGPEHDEMLFIVIHQVYELWFKQMLHEFDYLAERLRGGEHARAIHTLQRLRAILKTIVAQVDILETMTPLEFNAFRSYLESGSGFQSVQFREVEFVMGLKRENIFKHYPPETFGLDRLRRRFDEPTLWDAFLAYLALRGYAVPADQLGRDVAQPLKPAPALQAILIEIYRADAAVSNICERLVDLDEGFMEWRYRHIKMVERTIGGKPGTGGSPGAAYLATTVRPFFPDLWEIRSQL
ncbi:MAG TPA: tryptophan 2,3-dioxygenase family protein [Kouleothrix sp.]|uniref:tryptophan 2,3-dioxygenase n=1 Tax=Kouleothrix sp. TaxID=2779161 RepID=UPI002CC77698|nr:tryptophan 2,3-dioxygenase family protein [Kouleothrix sp.]